MKTFTIIFIAFIIFLSEITTVFSQSLSEKLPKEKFRNVYISVQGTYVRHLGDFSNTWASSTGAYISYGIYYPGNYILNFKTGYLKLRLKEGIDYPVNSEAYVIPFLVGGRYYFDLNFVQPYFSFTNGMNFVSQKADLRGNRDEKTLVKYYWQAGVGSFVRIHKNFKLDLSVNVNSHFYSDDAMMTGFEYTVGFLF